MNYEVKQIDKFRFIEEGQGEPLVLLHGLFGALSNFVDLIEHFKKSYTVVVPILPLFDFRLSFLSNPLYSPQLFFCNLKFTSHKITKLEA